MSLRARARKRERYIRQKYGEAIMAIDLKQVWKDWAEMEAAKAMGFSRLTLPPETKLET